MKKVLCYVFLMLLVGMGAYANGADSVGNVQTCSPLPLVRPEYQKGEAWSYNLKTEGSTSRSDIPSGDFTITWTDNGMDATVGLMETVPTLVETTVNRKWFDFITTPEPKWKSEFNMPQLGWMTASYSRMGWEKVEVPGGTFCALKIRRDDSGRRAADQWYEFWYAPEVRSVVKFRSENRTGTKRAMEYKGYTVSR